MDNTQSLKSGGALRPAMLLALSFAAIKLAIHIVSTHIALKNGYGIFRDELYYIMCGHHLAWGYVDHAPMVALQARLATSLFPRSIDGLRLLSELAGAAKVFLTGILAWSLGGSRIGQSLAMLGVLVVPQYLGLDSYLSMNSFEPVFWMTAMLAVILIVRGGSPRWWVVFGVAAGLGIENKPSIVVFLVALLVGLILTPQRRVLFTPWCLLGIGVMMLLGVPTLLWQIHYGFPTLEFLRNGSAENKNVKLPPLSFVLGQIASMHPLNVFLWGTGVVWLLVSRNPRNFRWIALCYLVFLTMMLVLHAKDYYLAPIYPVLFAAGGVAWQALLKRRSTAWLVPTYAVVLIITGALLLPMTIPVLRPPDWISYTQRLHLRSNDTENQEKGPLPQFYADRFGWQALTDDVTAIYESLPAEDRVKAGILCSNYGEASAINVLRRDPSLPVAVSGHNNYWLWGPHGYTGEVLIVINNASIEEMRQYYTSVEVAGSMHDPYAMPYEHRPIYLCRGRKANLSADWLSLKHYI